MNRITWLGLSLGTSDSVLWCFFSWGPGLSVNSRLASLRCDSRCVHFLSLRPVVRSYSCRAKSFNYTTCECQMAHKFEIKGRRDSVRGLSLVRCLYRSALSRSFRAGEKAPVCGGCRRVAATTFTGIGAFFPARACDIRVKVTRIGYVDSCWSQLHTMDAVHTAITPCQCLPFFISEPVDARRLNSERVRLLACFPQNPHHSQPLDPRGQAPDNTQHTFRTRSQFRILPTPTYQGRQTGLGPLYPGRCFF